MSDNDEVGYGKPPKWTQFQKGRSGNYKGRPKKAPSIDDAASSSDEVLREILKLEVGATDQHGSRSISSIEAVRRAQLRTALGGSPIAQHHFLRDVEDLLRRDAERARLKDQEEREAIETLARFRAKRQKVWETAAKLGVEPDQPWPHPDDILIDQAKRTWSIRGPFDEDDVPRFNEVRARRDVATFEAYRVWASTKPNTGLGALFELAAMQNDALLPLRWQVGGRLSEVLEQYCWLPARILERKEAAARLELSHWAAVNGPLVCPREVARKVNALLKPLLSKHGITGSIKLEH